MSESSRGRVEIERGAKRVRAVLGGATVLDTTEPRLVWEVPYYPDYYIPRQHVLARLEPAGHTAHSPSRGEAVSYDVHVGGQVAAGAAWAYPDSPLEELRELVRFEWDAFDDWFEEDELVYVHPRSPYVRVDILASTRRVQVSVDRIQLADSRQPRILFETGLPPRYYVALTDVAMGRLRPSTTISHCPYKGTASYWHVDIGGEVHQDLVWMYRAPLPESARIAGLACFYNEKVDLTIDGVLAPRPRTKFS